MKIYLKESLKYFLRSKLLISREIKKVQGLYDMSAEQLYEYEEEQFLKIFRWAYTKSAFYYKFYSIPYITNYSVWGKTHSNCSNCI